jgi:HSP20 family protein
MLTPLSDGLGSLFRLRSDMNRLFEDFFEDTPALRPYSPTYPAMNVWEDGDCAYFEAELPGMSMNDLDLHVLGSELTLTGQRKIEEPKNASWHRRERSQGRFSRTLTLPWEINADKVEAHLHDGVLTVKLPKCESCKPKKIKVLSA